MAPREENRAGGSLSIGIIGISASHSSRHPAHKNVHCVLNGQGRLVVRVPGLQDSGNLIPCSAAMSTAFANKIGTVMMPYCLEVGTAPSGGSLEVVGKIEKMDVVVILDLSHPLNLSLRFLKEFQAELDYSGDQPSIQIQEEQIPIETNMEILETEQYPGVRRAGEQRSGGIRGTNGASRPGRAGRHGRSGEGMPSPIQVSSFFSLKDTYQQSINKLELSFSSSKVIPRVDQSIWYHRAKLCGGLGVCPETAPQG